MSNLTDSIYSLNFFANLYVTSYHNYPIRTLPRPSSPIPDVVYRIFGDNSVSRPQFDGTFFAGYPSKMIDMANPIHVLQEVEKHAQWSNRQYTSFVSTTSSFDWMLYQTRRSFTPGEHCGWRGNVGVAVIYTADAIAQGYQIYKMADLVSWTGARIPDAARGPSRHEWVFLRGIPAFAVQKIYSAFEFWQVGMLYQVQLRFLLQGTTANTPKVTCWKEQLQQPVYSRRVEQAELPPQIRYRSEQRRGSPLLSNIKNHRYGIDNSVENDYVYEHENDLESHELWSSRNRHYQNQSNRLLVPEKTQLQLEHDSKPILPGYQDYMNYY